MTSLSQPQVTLIVLNWNARAFLEPCLRSLLAQTGPSFQVWLVDNDSSDDSIAFVQANFPQVQIWANRQNLGFSGGNNIALREVQTPYAVLLNPDIVAEPDWLTQLLIPLENDPTIGIAGCKLFYPDGRLQHAGGFLHLPLGLADHFGYLAQDSGQFETVQDVPYVIGAALAVRRSVWETVGLLDEGFFLYYEDTDWCQRVHRQGWRVVVVPQARLVHHESVLTEKNSLTYLRNFHYGRWRYLLKHLPPEQLLNETIPAEKAWLASKPEREQHAAAAAYHHLVTHLDETWAARVRDGNNAISPTQDEAITAALHHLHHLAWTSAAYTQLHSWQTRLEQIATWSIPAFRSPTPILGPLFNILRTLWSYLDTRPALEPIRQQQSHLNQQMAAITTGYLRYLETRHNHSEAKTNQHDQWHDQLRHLRHQLAQAHAHLDKLEAHLQQLERPRQL
ncbi:MAG: glycosyltransferase family 2 protein [Candidatus Promineifilaceae bacterium]